MLKEKESLGLGLPWVLSSLSVGDVRLQIELRAGARRGGGLLQVLALGGFGNQEPVVVEPSRHSLVAVGGERLLGGNHFFFVLCNLGEASEVGAAVTVEGSGVGRSLFGNCARNWHGRRSSSWRSDDGCRRSAGDGDRPRRSDGGSARSADDACRPTVYRRTPPGLNPTQNQLKLGVDGVEAIVESLRCLSIRQMLMTELEARKFQTPVHVAGGFERLQRRVVARRCGWSRATPPHFLVR